MTDHKEIKKDLTEIDPETIIKDLVKMVRKLKSEEEADRVRAGKPKFALLPNLALTPRMVHRLRWCPSDDFRLKLSIMRGIDRCGK